MKKMYAKCTFASRMIIVIFILLLVGCGSKKTDIPPDSSSEQTYETPNETDAPKIEDKSIESEESETFVLLKQARPFSEGLAWVLYEDSSGNEQVGWLHTDGYINQPFPIDKITQLRENYSYCSGLGSEFSGGYSYIATGDAFTRGASEIPDSFLILNTNGDVTAESPEDGSSYEVLCGDSGIYLVKQSIRSMTENTDKYGIIDAAGHWIVPCTECTENGENPFSPKGEISRERKGLGFAYCGESVFLAYYSYGPYEQHTVLYNAKTGAIHQMDQEIETIGACYDSKIPVKIDGNLFIMSADFELTPISVDTCDEVIYSEGVIFSADRNYSGNRKTYLTNGKFYHTDGSVLADLSQYELLYEDTYDLYRFSDGYVAIIICGADGGQYLGIIDMNGQFSFEPIKIESLSNWDNAGTFASGVIVCRTAENGIQIVDIDGVQTSSTYFEADHVENYIFRKGFACMGSYYIGIDGNALDVFVK